MFKYAMPKIQTTTMQQNRQVFLYETRLRGRGVPIPLICSCLNAGDVPGMVVEEAIEVFHTTCYMSLKQRKKTEVCVVWCISCDV
jgi:hypothetical protein